MASVPADPMEDLVLDGNAAGGVLQEIFEVDMTASPTECANCGCRGEMGTLLAYMQSPGVVLRCPACLSIMLRIVETPDAIYLDARGVTYLHLARHTS